MSHMFNWSESAFYWEKHRKSIEEMYEPISNAMIRLGKIDNKNLKILDIAGGIGEPSLTIVEREPTQRITITDLSFEMLKCAKKESENRSLTNLTFCSCNGEQLPFKSETYDRVISRLGLMFFPDPIGGLQEMLRVTQPGGRIVMAVWGYGEANPMFHIFTEILKHYVPAGPEPKEHENPFRFAPPGSLTAIAKEAGGRDIKEEVLNFSVQMPFTFDEFWTVRVEMSETLRQKLKALAEQQRDSLRNEVKEAVVPYFAKSQMDFPAQTVLMTCTK